MKRRGIAVLIYAAAFMALQFANQRYANNVLYVGRGFPDAPPEGETFRVMVSRLRIEGQKAKAGMQIIQRKKCLASARQGCRALQHDFASAVNGKIVAAVFAIMAFCIVAICGVTEAFAAAAEGSGTFASGADSTLAWTDSRRENAGGVNLRCLHTDIAGFYASLATPRVYPPGGRVAAGVVPHHMAGAKLISGFFELCAGSEYDTVVIIAPNHKGDIADVIVSRSDWDAFGVYIQPPSLRAAVCAAKQSSKPINFGLPRFARNDGEGIEQIQIIVHDVNTENDKKVANDTRINSDIRVSCDTDIADVILNMKIGGLKITENDRRVEEEHSASVLIPYIGHYFPGAAVVPVLVSRTASLDGTLSFAAALIKVISESGKRVLLVCSVDFSHSLPPEAAAKYDAETLRAIETLDYPKIQGLSNHYTDSPAALIIFLKYLEEMHSKAKLLDHADASEFLGRGINETTTYFVLAGFNGDR